MHVHVHCSDGEAKFWLEPNVVLAVNYGITSDRLHEAEQIIKAHFDEFRAAWQAHFHP